MVDQFNAALHPDAARNYNEKAEDLLRKLRPHKLRDQTPPPFRPDRFVSAALTRQDIIGDIETRVVDHKGMLVAKFFEHGNEMVGLSGQDFQDLAHIVQRLQKSARISGQISYECLLDVAFNWLKERHLRKVEQSFVEFVLTECGKRVTETEIWIPIFRLHLQTDIEIGKVRLRTITSQMLDDLEARLEERIGGDKAAFQQVFARKRKDMQGVAAATITLRAEPIRALQIARDEADKSISVLRFFHLANFSPSMRCYCTPLGRQALAMSTHLVVKEAKIISEGQKMEPKGSSAWILDADEVSDLRNGGLDTLGNMLANPNRTKFQTNLLEAIILYSKNALVEDPAEKLVFIFAGLESVLLKDRTEPVQKNLGERIAFLAGPSTEARLEILRNVEKTYDLRSAFVHHGESPDDMSTLEAFMKSAWISLCSLIEESSNFETKQLLIEALERRKMA